MKLYSKLSALGAVLVLTTAFASADIITLGSYGTGTPAGINQNTAMAYGNTTSKVNTGNKTRGPLLLTAGGQDHTVPAAITRSTRKLYHKSPAITDLQEFASRGHSLTIDSGWSEIAAYSLDWLRQRAFPG